MEPNKQPETIIIRTFFSASKEMMWDVGQRNGLSEKACELFKYFSGVELTLTVQKETGLVLSWRLSDHEGGQP